MDRAINTALDEYKKYPGLRNDYIVIVNYRDPSFKKRLYVYDLNHQIVVRLHHVAHGSKSSLEANQAFATYFSNKIGSRKSSLGAMKTGKTYYGKYGKSLKLHGLEPGKNNMVYARSIVLHSSRYVTDVYILEHGRAGQSWGCLAVDPSISDSLIELIKEGCFVYAYY